jgi:hypothetical protein
VRPPAQRPAHDHDQQDATEHSACGTREVERPSEAIALFDPEIWVLGLQ